MNKISSNTILMVLLLFIILSFNILISECCYLVLVTMLLVNGVILTISIALDMFLLSIITLSELFISLVILVQFTAIEQDTEYLKINKITIDDVFNVHLENGEVKKMDRLSPLCLRKNNNIFLVVNVKRKYFKTPIRGIKNITSIEKHITDTCIVKTEY